MAKLGYQNSETPEPIVTKFVFGDMTQYIPKLKPIAPMGASRQNG